MPYESLRKQFKPIRADVLFVGESRPNGNTFFYNEDSNLFIYTKEAFERALFIRFDCNYFMKLGCWLYDVCDEPVNHMTNQQRKEKIKLGIASLKKTVNKLKPKHIVAIKKGDFRTILKPNLEILGYAEGENLFFLPFPACGNQRRYVDKLTEILAFVMIKNQISL